jgi:CheY-like chemotaxis protein
VSSKALDILVVDDDSINIKFLTAVLASVAKQTGVDINAVSAASGQEALAIVESNTPDMILLDVMMPGMDGYEVCEKLKANPVTADIQIVFATAMDKEDERARGLGMGAIDYIRKPFEPDTVVKTLVQLIKPGATINASVQNTRAADDFPYQLPGIDIEDGLMRMQGNAKLFKQVLIEFRDSKANAGTELRKALARNDKENVAKLAHSLKGVAGNVGAIDLNQAAANLEGAVKEDRDPELLPLCAVLIQNLNQIMDTLSQLKSGASSPADDASTDRPQPVDMERTPLLLEALRGRLESNDMGADELIGPIKALLIGSEYANEIERLEACVERLDFPGALEKLNAITESISH